MRYSLVYLIIVAMLMATACKKDERVTGVSLDHSMMSLNMGETAELTATVLPLEAVDQTVYWRSENPEIATVINGRISGVSVGVSRIRVSTREGNFEASCLVTVTQPPPPPPPLITINNHPAPETDLTGGDISGNLSVDASVTQNQTLSYQWYINTTDSNTDGVAVSGETAAYFRIPTDLAAEGSPYYFYCEVHATGEAASVVSNVARVNVTAPVIIITAEPEQITNVAFGSIQGGLSVEASITGTSTIDYQWYVNTTNSNTGGNVIANETGAEFSIPTTLAIGTYYYFCEVRATDGAVPVRSEVATVHVAAAYEITITTQPEENINLTVGSITGSVTLFATITHDVALNYQWYSNTINSNSGGTLIAGATEPNFAIPPTLGEGNYYYFCEISAIGANTVRSEVAMVNVSIPVITIIAQPQETIDAIAGSIANISIYVEANATGEATTLSYQWYNSATDSNMDGTPIAGATSASFSVPATLTSGVYYYFCEVQATSGAHPVRSDVAKVDVVVPAITINTQPEAITNVASGETSASLTVGASATGNATTLSYQWYRNTTDSNTGGTVILGATSPSFAIPATLTFAGSPYYYFCEISATSGAVSVRSEVARVNVVAAVITINKQPEATYNLIRGGTTDNITIEASVTGNATLTYRWHRNTTNSNEGGTAIVGPAGTQQTASYMIPTGLQVGTYYYFCEVQATNGAVSVRSEVATVIVEAPIITINKQPEAITNVAPDAITGSLTVEASVTGSATTLSYQWYSNTTNSNTGGTVITGATTSSYTIPTNLTATGSPYYYFCEVRATNDAVPVRSEVARVNIVVPIISINTQPAANINEIVGNIASSLTVEASVNTNATISYQWFSATTNSNAAGTALAGETSENFTIPTTLTAGTYYYFCEVRATGGAIPVRTNVTTVNVVAPVITINTQPVASINEIAGNITAGLTVEASVNANATISYQWFSSTTNSNAAGTALTGETSENFTIPTTLTAGTYYYFCEVRATGGAIPVRTEPTKVNITAPLITINVQPVTTVNLVASNISGNLNVTASVTGGATLTYQWYSATTDDNAGGTVISGATSTSFTIPTTLIEGTYYYFCEVRASGGAVSVRTNVTTVSVAPVITINTQPAAVTEIFEGNTTGSLFVVASVNEDATLSYQWYRNTSNSNSGGTAIAGATSSNFAIPTQVGGTFFYFCEIKTTNGVSSVRSDVATVNVILVDNWIQKANYRGGAISNAVGFSIGNKGYIGTGNTITGTTLRSFWEYDPISNVWTQKADFAGVARSGAVGFSIGNKGYIGAGTSGGSDLRRDFWEYNPDLNFWTQKTDFPGEARTDMVGFSIGDKGYAGVGRVQQDFWEYDPVSDVWTQKANFAGVARYGAVSFSIGNKGYIGTGERPNPFAYLVDFWEYDPVTNVWTQKADFEGGSRTYAVGFSIGNKGYVGTGSVFISGRQEFWEYDPVSNTWTQKADFEGGDRRGAVGFSIGNKGYVGTGANTGSGPNFQDFWEYTP